MTQQFKFGDRAHVVSETGVSGAVLISDLTLIPHPDTAMREKAA